MAIAIDGRSVIEINEDDHTLCQEYLGMDVHMNGRTGEIALKCLREYFNCRKNWALEEHELDFYIWVLALPNKIDYHISSITCSYFLGSFIFEAYRGDCKLYMGCGTISEFAPQV